MLNRVTLEPGESMFVPSGHVHAYLSGCAVEIMASSDNVLRAGLTSKLVDVDALLECATCTPGPAARPRLVDDGSGLVAYRPPVAEFALRAGRVAGAVALPAAGPRVVLCLDGAVALAAAPRADAGAERRADAEAEPGTRLVRESPCSSRTVRGRRRARRGRGRRRLCAVTGARTGAPGVPAQRYHVRGRGAT